jgi:anti-sigma factor RsiW
MLWKIKSGAISENAGQRQQARQAAQCEAALWQRVREATRDNTAGHAAAGNAPVDESDTRPGEVAALGEVSDALRLALAEECDSTLRQAQEARSAFVSIHTRLMQEITAEQDSSPSLQSEEVTTSHKAFNRARAKRRFRVLGQRPALQWALALLCMSAVGFGGHRIGSRSASKELPVQSLVDDFDAGLHSATPLEFIADENLDNSAVSQWLSQRVGMKVQLPARHAGTKLLGAKRHPLWNRPGVQTHYLKNGIHVGLYQIRDPRCALANMDEVEIKGKLFLVGVHGPYHVVVWRNGDDVMALVSPLRQNESLRLASLMRTPGKST